MNITEEAKSVLGVEDQALYRRAYRWYYNSATGTDTAADNLHRKALESGVRPHFLLAFCQATIRTRKRAA